MLPNDLLSSELLAGVIGSVVGAVLSFSFFKRYEKKKFTLEFHKEWNSKEMSTIRRMADKCLLKYPSESYGGLRYEDEEGSVYVYIVMRFFQRLWICIKSDNIQKNLSVDLFKDFFFYWYFVSYEKNLIPYKNDFMAASEIEDFYMWLKNRVSFTEFDEFKKKYQNRYNERLNESRKGEPKMNETEMGNPNTIKLTAPFNNISSITVTQTPKKYFLSFFEQLRVLELKENLSSDEEILRIFDEEEIIKKSDIERLGVLEKHLEIISGEEKNYYKTLKKILFDKAKNEIGLL